GIGYVLLRFQEQGRVQGILQNHEAFQAKQVEQVLGVHDSHNVVEVLFRKPASAYARRGEPPPVLCREGCSTPEPPFPPAAPCSLGPVSRTGESPSARTQPGSG